MPSTNNPETRDDVREALVRLDTSVDALWNQDGTPTIEAVQRILGANITVTRDMIVDAAPEFTRINPNVPADDDSEAGDGSVEVAEASEEQALTDEASIAVLDTQIAALEEQRGVLVLELQRLNAERDVLTRRVEKNRRKPVTHTIKAFLDSQQKQRKQKAEDEREAREIVAARRQARTTTVARPATVSPGAAGRASRH
jgi:hypothetical protein